MELIDLLGDFGKLAGVADLLREVNPPFQEAGPTGWFTTKSGKRVQLGMYSPHTKRATLRITSKKTGKSKAYKSKVFKTKPPAKNKNPKYKYRLKTPSKKIGKKDVLWSKILAARTATLKKRMERRADFGDLLQENWITKDGNKIFIGGPKGERIQVGYHASLVDSPTAPPKDNPVTVVFGGSFNPPHVGHVWAANEAVQLLHDSGYNVTNLIVAPTADKLIKDKLPDRLSLADRTELARLTFTNPGVSVTDAPALQAESTQGKLRRTQLADWAAKEYPGHTVINVTGEDSAPGHPPGYPSVYEGDKGSNHEGYYYIALARPKGGLSSSTIRHSVSTGEAPTGMTPAAERRFLQMQTHKTEQTLAEALREEFHLDHTGTLSENILGGVLEEDQRWLTPEEIHAIIAEAGGERWITKDGKRIFIGGNGPHAGKHIMVGIAPYRAHNVDSIDKVPALFDDAKSRNFEKQIPAIATEFKGVNVAQVRRTAGVWQSNREASFMITGSATNETALDAYAAKLGETAPERQMAVVAFTEDQKGKGFAYQLLGVKNQEAAVKVLLQHGFEGAAVPLNSGKIILFDENGSLRGNIKKASQELHLRYTNTRGHVHFIGENDYAKIQSEYSKTKTEGQEIHHRHAAYLSEAGDGQEITGRLMDREDIAALMQIAEVAGQLHFITLDGRVIPIGGQTTTAQQFRSSSGKWHPSRVAIADKVAENMVAGKTVAVDRKPIAWILGGGTAVGKTSVADLLIGEHPNAVKIDTDVFKLAVPEYEHYKTIDPINAAHLVHDESKMITEKVLEETVGRRLDFTFDSTTSGKGGPALIQLLHDKGYDVRAIFVDLPISTAIERSALRTTESHKPENFGRVVPEGVIRSTHLGASQNFFDLKDSPNLTSIELWDNSKFRQPPTPVYKRTNVNGALGQEKIYDQQRFRKYSRKSVGLSEAAKKIRFLRPGHLPNTGGRGQVGERDSEGGRESSEGEVIAELILETQSALDGISSRLRLLTD